MGPRMRRELAAETTSWRRTLTGLGFDKAISNCKTPEFRHHTPFTCSCLCMSIQYSRRAESRSTEYQCLHLSYFTGKYPQFLKDPEFQGEMDQAFQRLSVLFGVGIFVSCGVINGAILYNVYMVLLGMVYAVVQSVFVMFFLSPILMKHLNFYIGGCVVFLLAFLTPHYNFVEEYYDRRTPRSFRDDVRADDSELFMTN